MENSSKNAYSRSLPLFVQTKKRLFENISLSARTVTRRIEELSENVKSSLRERASEFAYYSLAFDESTDAKDTAQLAVFVRGVSGQFDVTEELASLIAMKDKTTGADLLRVVKYVMNDIGLSYEQLCGVSTDGAPSMVGSERRSGANGEGKVGHRHSNKTVQDTLHYSPGSTVCEIAKNAECDERRRENCEPCAQAGPESQTVLTAAA